MRSLAKIQAVHRARAALERAVVAAKGSPARPEPSPEYKPAKKSKRKATKTVKKTKSKSRAESKARRTRHALRALASMSSATTTRRLDRLEAEQATAVAEHDDPIIRSVIARVGSDAFAATHARRLERMRGESEPRHLDAAGRAQRASLERSVLAALPADQHEDALRKFRAGLDRRLAGR